LLIPRRHHLLRADAIAVPAQQNWARPQSTVQANQNFGEYQDSWFVKIFRAAKVKGNFAAELPQIPEPQEWQGTALTLSDLSSAGPLPNNRDGPIFE
jgi:hypothetical protein